MADKETKFDRGLSVGVKDCGMGRTDYAVLRKTDGERRLLVAEIPGVGTQEGQNFTEGDVNASLENAFLFAAAPALYDACVDALRQMKDFQRHGSRAFNDEIDQLEKAITKATKW